MALKFPMLVQAKTVTTGQGTYTIDETGTPNGKRSFTQAVTAVDLAHNDQVLYAVIDSTVTNSMELGKGTWDNVAKTLTRDKVFQPNGTAVNWGAGTKDVVVVDYMSIAALLEGVLNAEILRIILAGSAISPTANAGLLVQNSGVVGDDAEVSIVSGTSGFAQLNLGDTDDEDRGGVRYDHGTDRLYARTAAALRDYVGSSGGWFDSGGTPYDKFAGGGATGIVFKQPAAPTGWTKSTADDDAALRVVSGTPGASAGVRGLSSATVGSHALTTAELAAHTHPKFGTDIGFEHLTASSGGSVALASGTQVWNSRATTGSTGSGTGHDHPLDLKRVDVIICTKD